MAADSKTEAPTPQRRKSAREEGRAAVSRDLTAGLALLAACAAARLCWSRTSAALAAAAEQTILFASRRDVGPEAFGSLFRFWEQVTLQALAPIVGSALVIGLIVGLVQTRLMFSMKSMQPTIDKLSPVNGFKRIFSIRGAVEAAKGLLKVGLVLGVVAWALWARREDFARLSDCSTAGAVSLATDLVFMVLFRCGALLLIIGVADYAYQYWEFERSLRMSKQDVIDEHKRMEGDPNMRSRRRALRRNMLQQGISREMPESTVVVRNPTHIAVALKYGPGMPAPKVVAKGRHLIAQRIVKLADKHGIPVVQNVQVARALYKAAAVGDYVPGPLYQAVAEILAIIYRRRQERKQRQERAQRDYAE